MCTDYIASIHERASSATLSSDHKIFGDRDWEAVKQTNLSQPPRGAGRRAAGEFHVSELVGHSNHRAPPIPLSGASWSDCTAPDVIVVGGVEGLASQPAFEANSNHVVRGGRSLRARWNVVLVHTTSTRLLREHPQGGIACGVQDAPRNRCKENIDSAFGRSFVRSCSEFMHTRLLKRSAVERIFERFRSRGAPGAGVGNQTLPRCQPPSEKWQWQTKLPTD